MIRFAFIFSLLFLAGHFSPKAIAFQMANQPVEQGVMNDNMASSVQANVNLFAIFIRLYLSKHSNVWPDSWESIDEKEAAKLGWRGADKKEFMRSFAFIPEIAGKIDSREEGKYESSLMLILAEPIQHPSSRGNSELGRWVIWKNSQGQLLTRWHPEKEIISFSKWGEVQHAIDTHLISVKKRELVGTMSPDFSSSPLDENPSPMPKALETMPSTPREEPTSSTPWSVVAVLIVAATGLLWLLVKKRN